VIAVPIHLLKIIYLEDKWSKWRLATLSHVKLFGKISISAGKLVGSEQ
jgi:hypothetical protein